MPEPSFTWIWKTPEVIALVPLKTVQINEMKINEMNELMKWNENPSIINSLFQSKVPK